MNGFALRLVLTRSKRELEMAYYKAFSLMWPAHMQINSLKQKGVYMRKEFNSHRIGLVH